MKRLFIIVLLFLIVFPVSAQDEPFAVTNTPPGNEAVVTEPVVTEEPAEEPTVTESGQLVAMVERITNTLLVVIGVLTVLAGTLGIALFNSVPARVLFSGAVNHARPGQ